MRIFAKNPKATQQPTSAKTMTPGWAHLGQVRDVNSLLHLQRPFGSHDLERQPQAQDLEDESPISASSRFAHDFSRIPVHAGAPKTIQRRLRVDDPCAQPGRLACATIPAVKATAMEDQGKTGAEVFEGVPMTIHPEAPDQTAMPLNEDGLIDGEWTSDVIAHVFVNGGKVGTAIVNWVGGAGGTTPGIGSSTTVAPVIDTSAPAAAGGTASAWVRAGTGTVSVSRSYTGVLVGANGADYYITGRAATRIDRHEENHIAHSKTHHDAFLTPLETRIAQHTGQPKALNAGADAAAAKTALETFLKWNDSLTSFRNADLADNKPGGTVDTADAATADFYRDYGARAVGGVNYAHYVDTPPGP